MSAGSDAQEPPGVPAARTDAELVARVLEGHGEAFGAVADRYYESCMRYAWLLLRRREDAEDAVQETFLAAFRALGRYREQDRFKAWLWRILSNQCRSLARRRGKRERHVVNDEGLVETAAALPPAESSDMVDVLRSALEVLDLPGREVFLLKYGEGLEYEEMSRITGIGVSALKMRVRRAADRIRPKLEALLDE